MPIASLPLNEDLRLQDLYSYGILDSGKDREFDDLLEVAADICGCPIAAISFLDSERQWFKSKIGLADDLHETARSLSFCAHTILENEVLIIKDARNDDRFCNHPFVESDLNIRFYAGAPIVSPTGYSLGSVCVIDNKPRDLPEAKARTLQIISRQISKLLELRLKNKLLKQKAEEQLQLEKRLLQKTLQQHEEEKQSIGRELHENIAQGLAATKFYLEMAEGGSLDRANLIRMSRQHIASLVKQVRELSQAISPSLLQQVELKDLLRGMLKDFSHRTAVITQLHYEGEAVVAASLALTIYRIVEEQLLNVQQHACAKQVTIHLRVTASVHITICDDGVGIDMLNFKRGVGINKILSSAEHLNGTVKLSGGPKGGCELRVAIPATC